MASDERIKSYMRDESLPDPNRREVDLTQARLNHVGLTFESREEYEAAAKLLEKIGLTPVLRTAPDHERIFFDLSQAGPVELELQLWPEPGPFRAHFDIDVEIIEEDDPMEILKQLSPTPKDWGRGEIPRGGGELIENDNLTKNLSVMVRPRIQK